MTEDTLIAAAAGGDEQAFETLLDVHYERIYRFAYRWCGNATDAEDITQLACIKLARTIGQFRGDAAFTSWLFRLVVNCAKDWQKSQRRHQGEQLTGNPGLCAPCESEAQTEQHTVYLIEILNTVDAMGQGFKETALLVLGEGFSHREAGALLGVKESTVSWRLHQMRQQLSSLGEEMGG